MTPEELEAFRGWCWKFEIPPDSMIAKALEHIDQQAASLVEADALTKKNAELMNRFLARIVELESQILHQTGISACRIEERERHQKQITALKEIAVEERACRLSSPETGAIPTVEHYNAMDPEGSMLEACHQLEEEHPEAFR